MDAFFQAFGAWIGISAVNALESGVALNTAKCFVPINPWFYFLVFPILSMAINVQFGASWRHMPICVVVNAAAFVVVYFMSSVTTSSVLPVGVAGKLNLHSLRYGFRTLVLMPFLYSVRDRLDL
jgi:anaerobic C4-dicarboxylate transporter